MRFAGAVVGLVLVSLILTCQVARAAGGIATLLIENDAFTDSDRNYTSGLKLDYLIPSTAHDPIRSFVAAHLWPGADKATMRSNIAIGQSQFTPHDLSTTTPDPNDRPYAAWLYADYAIIAITDRSQTIAELEMGVIGPSAGGKWLQSNFHGWLDEHEPQGWDNQLPDQFGFDFTLERSWRQPRIDLPLGLQGEARPHLGVTVGNVTDEAFGGLTLRLGMDLDSSDLPLRVRPSLSGVGSYDVTSGIGWYVFAGASARAVAYSVFLDGDPPYHSNVYSRPVVFDLQYGLALRLWRAQVAFTEVERTKQFNTQHGMDRFGAISFSWHF